MSGHLQDVSKATKQANEKYYNNFAIFTRFNTLILFKHLPEKFNFH